ncbi:MAG: hypothetical protein IJF54_07705 [Clostridia bacterium]|nr:hypothetical protein [Clostridia bacterium]
MAFLLGFCNVCLLVGIITVIYGFSQLRVEDLGKQREIAGSANLVTQIYVIFVLIIAAPIKRPFDSEHIWIIVALTLYVLCAAVSGVWLCVLSLRKKSQSAKVKGRVFLTVILGLAAALFLALVIMLGEDLTLACAFSTFIYISLGDAMLTNILSLTVVPIVCFATLILNIIAIWGKKKRD